MKTKFTTSIITLSLLSIFIFSGCKKKDDPKNFTNEDYAGTWNVSLQCNTAVSFQMTIAANGSDGVTITNFHKQGYPTGFTVTGTVADGKLTIPSQAKTSTSQGGPYTFAGSGSMSSASALSIPYTMTSGSSISCTATCTK